MSGYRRGLTSMGAALAVVAGMLLSAAPASASGPAFQFDFPAGTACAGFDLRIEGYGSGQQVSRELPGGRIIGAGTGYGLVYTNLATGASLSTRANGAVSITTTDEDGSSTMAMMGHNVVILFPSDDGGPGVTLYVGKVVVSVGSDGVWSVQRVSGTATDVCATLS